MPASSRSKKSSSKASKKSATKVAKKATRKAASKTAKKVAKKAAGKAGKKVAKKAAGKAGKKIAKKAAGKTAARPRSSGRKGGKVSPQKRHEMIEKAAYYRAVERNFQDGDAVADWLSGEKEIDVLLSNADR